MTELDISIGIVALGILILLVGLFFSCGRQILAEWKKETQAKQNKLKKKPCK